MNHEYEIDLYGGLRSEPAENLPQFGSPHTQNCTLGDFAIYSQVGGEMGIPVTVVAIAGQTYNRVSSTVVEVNGMPVGESVRSRVETVPDGHVRVEIANEIRRMGDFYTRVDALSQQPSLPSGPTQ